MDMVSLAGMIAPIAGDAVAGADLRAAGPGSEMYLAAKDDRAAARAAEREALASGDIDNDPLVAGLRLWEQVANHGGTLLCTHSKDLQVAAWVVEAWLRMDGFAGLADGFTLLAELVENYWDEGLHPQEDEDGVETRLAPLFGLFGHDEAGTLLQPIKLLPLSDLADEHVALWTVETARGQSVRHDDPELRGELTARRDQRIAELDKIVAGASAEFVATCLDSIERALTELDRLMTSLDRRTPHGRFGSKIANPLEAISDLLRQYSATPTATNATDAGVTAPVAVESRLDAAPALSPPAAKSLDRPGALATLVEIAGFFDKTEPQSLIGNSLRDLVRRANLPLDQLMAELLPDREQRAMFLLRAGIAPPRSGDMTTDFSIS